VARIVDSVLFEPVPTITRVCAAVQARRTASMTVCFSPASSALASPVVPRATMPLTPAEENS